METNFKKLISLLTIGVVCVSQLTFAQSRKRRTPAGYDDGIAKKWEMRFALGGQNGTKKDKAVLLDMGFGYNLNSNLYMGLSTGLYPKFGVVDGLKSDNVIPVMADLTFRVNPESDHWSPFFQVRGGYMMHTKTNDYLEKECLPYERKGYTAFEFGPGLCFRILRNIDLRMSLDYAVAVPGDDGFDPARNSTEYLFQARLGMSFRGKPKSGTRSEMRAEAARKAAEEQHRRDEEWAAQQKAEAEEARLREEAAREERRRRREAAAQQTAQMFSASSNEAPVEFYCHVTSAMVDSEGLDNQLVKLAALAAGKSVQTIVVLGYSNKPNSTDASDVIEASSRADKVKNYLNKRYVISKNLITTAFSGFEEHSSPNTRPNDAIATIMIQKVAEQKK